LEANCHALCRHEWWQSPRREGNRDRCPTRAVAAKLINLLDGVA
jgi:hypothetical protein